MSKRSSAGSLTVVGLCLTLAVSLISGPAEGGQGASQAPAERGKYLVGITGCHDCHSPKASGMTPDLTRALSGRPSTTKVPGPSKDEVHASLDFTSFAGPWGQTVASNLTPDAATGIGTRYNEASFITAMRTGKKPNGTQIQPPMPNEVYQNMTDDDLKAIWAYLRTIKPIRNAVLAGAPPPAPAGGQK
jgi:cytochrome c553